MSEFNNRMSAQRAILYSVNCVNWTEELFGLSSGAIDRWTNVNKIESHEKLVELIRNVAEKLFFLSNKSQEQITEDYKGLSTEVAELTILIKQAILKHTYTEDI